jgi:hypothetical protein
VPHAAGRSSLVSRLCSLFSHPECGTSLICPLIASGWQLRMMGIRVHNAVVRIGHEHRPSRPHQRPSHPETFQSSRGENYYKLMSPPIWSIHRPSLPGLAIGVDQWQWNPFSAIAVVHQLCVSAGRPVSCLHGRTLLIVTPQMPVRDVVARCLVRASVSQTHKRRCSSRVDTTLMCSLMSEATSSLELLVVLKGEDAVRPVHRATVQLSSSAYDGLGTEPASRHGFQHLHQIQDPAPLRKKRSAQIRGLFRATVSKPRLLFATSSLPETSGKSHSGKTWSLRHDQKGRARSHG